MVIKIERKRNVNLIKVWNGVKDLFYKPLRNP